MGVGDGVPGGSVAVAEGVRVGVAETVTVAEGVSVLVGVSVKVGSGRLWGACMAANNPTQ